MTVEEWESHSDLESVKDEVLRDALKEVFGIRSAAYFLKKSEKIDFIRDESSRPRFLELAANRRTDYRKPTVKLSEKVLAAAGDEPWMFLGHCRFPEGRVDPWSERKVTKMVQLSRGDERVFVQPRSAQVLRKNSLLRGWREPTRRNKKPKGITTLAQVLEGSKTRPKPLVKVEPTPLVDEVLEEEPLSMSVEEHAEKILEEEAVDYEQSLDDLLNEVFNS